MEKKEEKNNEKLQGLPVDSSPYTQYKDLEDYKEQGYGTHGHQTPQPGRGAAGSTDAPTVTGASPAADEKAQLSGTDAVNRQGVP